MFYISHTVIVSPSSPDMFFCQDGNSVDGQRHSQQVIMYSITKWNTEILSEWPHTETDEGNTF